MKTISDTYNLEQALALARSIKYGPLPKPEDPTPGIEEAIAVIHAEQRTCGFTWLTGETAKRILIEAKTHWRQHADATKVIFRKWRTEGGNWRIFAVFPELPSDSDGYLCQSYEHIGQHSAANAAVVQQLSVPARPEEYRELQAELEQIGYTLQILRRFPARAIDARREYLKRFDHRFVVISTE